LNSTHPTESNPRGIVSCGEGAGGDGLEFIGTVNAVVEGKGAGEYALDGAGPEGNLPSGSQTPKDGCLRQPAKARFWKTAAGGRDLPNSQMKAGVKTADAMRESLLPD
jgi:hypothetical protein